ncbi:alpha/beta fold hydrolase [uncultured Jatrophihabitans sp.]|uniref:alpha/beta fold hydrolase n=1 Tax=uncultured Jatrophihabitans sp. TaxID=1610747 RepID=UPI0035C9D9AC
MSPAPALSTVTIGNGPVALVTDEYRVPDARGVVLLWHGGGQTRHSWKATAEHVARAGWTAVSVDTRGHGDSTWAPDGDYSMDVLVGDVVAAAQRYPSPVLIGASLGGLMSLVAVGTGRVAARGLVLVDVAPRIERDGTRRIGEFMRRHAETGFADLDEVADAVAAYNPHRPRPTSTDGLRKNVRRRDDGRWYWHWDPRMMRADADEPSRQVDVDMLRSAARRISVPTLLVRGRQSDVLSEEGVRDFLELVPHAGFVDVGGTGHMVAGDDNDAFGGAITEFLARV